ncbi:serine hydrolase domain-containing protein [Planomonospora venezuelensis]|uniref:CubicO group peptidase (Beta-lactamase class C family) n=1 Tax=Planomonospora venezuelensis TaxID=1999 RepID=A0A841CZK4_PLAVE|nr:serine hydrolase domain-containing protein [Planomonospora venezuelensis]MBB5961375.1 CubicO group peptidase (beta-lactamase class C family) [Planomonospora venezuelensis]GIN01883.1 esterase [Planomonospora venezuelensis]
MSDLQKDVQAAIDELVGSGAERGVQVAVYRRGELLVDAVAGVADPATGRAFTSDTPVYVTSTGKGVISAVVHVLAERGVIDYDAPIASYWPEFGACGKDRATVRHALTHSAGVPGVPVDTTPEDLADWDRMCAVIAAAKPWWEPGTRFGYHPQTFMFIAGEIVRRTTGKTVSQVLREEVAEPLGLTGELFLAVPPAELPRLAVIEDAQPPAGAGTEMPPEMLAEIPFFRVVDGYTAAPMAAMPDAAYSNRPDILTSDSGATMTARAVARVYDALLNGLISAERLREVTTPAASGTDEITGMPATWGLGYATGMLDRPTVFGMPGSGGTAAFADTATGISVGVTKNRASAGDFSTIERVARIVL